jgi:hypothetical protein
MEQRYAQVAAMSQENYEIASRLGKQRDAGFALMTRGLAALGCGDFVGARALLRHSLAQYQVTSTADDQCFTYFGLSYAERALGNRRGARNAAIAALQLSAKTRSARVMRMAIGAYTGLLLDEQQVERAIELETMLMRNPSRGNSLYYRALVSEPVERAAAHLPAEVVAAARVRGLARDIATVVEELLSETMGTAA